MTASTPDPQQSAENTPPASESEGGRYADDNRMVTVRMPVRRAPRIGRFIAAGIVVGMLVGVVVGLLPAAPPAEGVNPDVAYDPTGVVAFWAALFGVFGGLAGAAVAVIIDRRS